MKKMKKMLCTYIVDLLKFFLVDQAPTSLPGLAIGSVQFIIDKLSNYKTSPFDLMDLWAETVRHGTKMLFIRKESILDEYGLMASAHILTFPTKFKNDYDSMDGCARAVNEHFFNYGPRGKSLFNLYRKPGKNREKVQFRLNPDDVTPFDDPAFFPLLKEDLFLNITCLNAFFMQSKFTIASIYEYYLKEWYRFKTESAAKVPNSFAFELLAHWWVYLLFWTFECMRKNECYGWN